MKASTEEANTWSFRWIIQARNGSFQGQGVACWRWKLSIKYTEFEKLQAVKCVSSQSVGWQWWMPEMRLEMNVEVRSQRSLCKLWYGIFPHLKAMGGKTKDWKQEHDMTTNLETKVVNCKKARQGDQVGGFCGNPSKRWHLVVKMERREPSESQEKSRTDRA